MTGEEIFTVTNKHVDDCGVPPSINFEDYDYVSYFENSHGEQSIFLFDQESRQVMVYLADAGWENPIQVPIDEVGEGNLERDSSSSGIQPNREEKQWLRACKSAVKR